MNKQMNLSFFHDELKDSKTHKQEYLEQTERIIPWEELEERAITGGERGN